MAQTDRLLDAERFCCPICLELLEEPVAIPCGHSYCMGCIQRHWGPAAGPEGAPGLYSCPQCGQAFSPRPALNPNAILADMMEQLKKTGAQPHRRRRTSLPPPTQGGGGAQGGPTCDLCAGARRPAVRSCLVCLASFCEPHLRAHLESPALRRHALVEAGGLGLRGRVCPRHCKPLEIYCRADRLCICFLCAMDEHKDHDTVSVATESAKKQRHLGTTKREFKLHLHARERELQKLQQAVDTLKMSARVAADDSDRIFCELALSVERRREEVQELIQVQEGAALRLLQQLEEEIAELRTRDAELEALLHSEDHLHVLQSCQFFLGPTGIGAPPSDTPTPLFDFGKMSGAVSALKKRVEDVLRADWPKISRAASAARLIPIPEPSTRPEFLHHSWQLLLDRRSAHRDLILSQDHTSAAVRGRRPPCPPHPERFDYWCQVLAGEGLAGWRRYWEAEWSGLGVYVALAYADMGRKGDGSHAHLGRNDKSWSLFCSRKGYAFWHDNAVTRIPGPGAAKIGIYLDHRAGTLAFYGVSGDTMSLVHRVHTSFTQPLYPGFEFACYGVSARICSIE